MKIIKTLLFMIVSILLSACSEGPEKLEGTWKMNGLAPLTVTYRNGEEETMGMISKVQYKHEGNDVLVTYVSGLAKGTTVRITFTGKDSAKTSMGTLTRIK